MFKIDYTDNKNWRINMEIPSTKRSIAIARKLLDVLEMDCKEESKENIGFGINLTNPDRCDHEPKLLNPAPGIPEDIIEPEKHYGEIDKIPITPMGDMQEFYEEVWDKESAKFPQVSEGVEDIMKTSEDAKSLANKEIEENKPKPEGRPVETIFIKFKSNQQLAKKVFLMMKEYPNRVWLNKDIQTQYPMEHPVGLCAVLRTLIKANAIKKVNRGEYKYNPGAVIGSCPPGQKAKEVQDEILRFFKLKPGILISRKQINQNCKFRNLKIHINTLVRDRVISKCSGNNKEFYFSYGPPTNLPMGFTMHNKAKEIPTEELEKLKE